MTPAPRAANNSTGTATSRLAQGRAAARKATRARLAISGPSGSGKALRDDQPVLTPSGWTPIATLEPGDQVMGRDGQPCTVTGVHPQGVRALSEVVFSDGTVVVSDDDHLWSTQTVAERGAGVPGSVRTTADIAGTLRDGRGRVQHYVPMTAPVAYPEVVLPVDPYVLGVLLGDGGMSSRDVVLSCPDAEVVDAVAKHYELRPVKGDPIGWRVQGAGPDMRALGLMGARSVDKHVPELYLRASAAQRLALLQGLLDSDGYAGGHTCEWASSSPRLVDAFAELVQSLGGLVTITPRTPTYSYRGERRTGAPAWRVYVKLPAEIAPFRLTRKALAYTPRTKYQPYRQIVDVRPCAAGLATCISVDSPDRLYLTVGHVPTHNTWTALSVAEVLAPSGPTLVIDTEPGDGGQGAAELYADRFRFDTIQWDPPYDPRDLALTVRDAGNATTPDGHWPGAEGYAVIVVDSASHFWRGPGGTLDIADGRFGGWKTATPVQDHLVEAILRSPAHMVVCTRAKQAYEVQEGPDKKQTVVKLGLAPIQRDDLEYEFQVVVMMDHEHRIDVGKTRCADLAGKSYHANEQARFAEVYGQWLDAGVQLARQADVDTMRAVVAYLPDARERDRVAKAFKAEFGSPSQLHEDRTAEAYAWLAATLDIGGHRFDPPADDPTLDSCVGCGGGGRAPWHDEDAPPPPRPEPAPDPEPEPEAEPTPEEAAPPQDTLLGVPPGGVANAETERAQRIVALLKGMDRESLTGLLKDRKLSTNGNDDSLRLRLGKALVTEGYNPPDDQ